MEKTKIEKIMHEICHKIGGDWLLVGGALVQIHYNGGRATEDIDLVHIRHKNKSKEIVQDELYKYALKSWGMGPEFINLSVEFFVHELKGWEKEIVLLSEGPSGRFFRPSLTLFCALKMRRATELDQDDIKFVIKKEGAVALNFEKLKLWLNKKQIEVIKKIIEKC